MGIRLLLLTLLTGTSLSHARDNCSTIDLTAGLGDTWNQVDTEWCHAFSTTDSLTKHLQNRGVLKKGERLHPLQIAAALPLAKGRSVVNSTEEHGTMLGDMYALDSAGTSHDGMINRHLCLESDLKAQKDRAQALFNEDWNLAHGIFHRSNCENHPNTCPILEDPITDVKSICDNLVAEESHYWAKLFEKRCHLDWPSWKVHRPYYNKARYEVMKSGKTLGPHGRKADNATVRAEIDAALKSNELAAIGYDVNFLRKKGSAIEPESHWSTVAGRKRGTDGKCYYVLRNSWGPDCHLYNPSANCTKGWLTVAEDQLLPRIHSVHYFEN